MEVVIVNVITVVVEQPTWSVSTTAIVIGHRYHRRSYHHSPYYFQHSLWFHQLSHWCVRCLLSALCSLFTKYNSSVSYCSTTVVGCRHHTFIDTIPKTTLLCKSLVKAKIINSPVVGHNIPLAAVYRSCSRDRLVVSSYTGTAVVESYRLFSPPRDTRGYDGIIIFILLFSQAIPFCC